METEGPIVGGDAQVASRSCEARAGEGEVYRITGGGATGACEGFRWVRGTEPFGVRPREGVVDSQLHSGGCGAA